MFRLRQVRKRFGDTAALAGIDLDVPAGKTVVLLGPSGCGKSTLLRLLVGLITPDHGRLEFEGQPLSPGRLAAQRLRMGYVIQEGGLFPHLTCERNVTLAARHHGVDRDEMEARLDELADLVRLDRETLDRFPTELSGGQRQRVALMRALMLDPDVLLLDEPLGALDPMIRAELQDDLAAIFCRLGKSVVLVTHDLGEAGFFADTIVLLRDGAIVQTGTLADLVRRPADPFVARFVWAQRGPFDALRDEES